MRKGKLILAAVSAVILAVIVLLCPASAPKPGNDLPVVLQAGDEQLQLWTADAETWYGFLPASARETVLLSSDTPATLDGLPLPLQLQDFSVPHTLAWEDGGTQRRGTLILLASENVASLHIDTQSGSMDYIHAQKGNAERGSLRLYDDQGSLNYTGTLASIRGRGNSTWVVHEKKPYSLELTEEADLLGMGAGKKWVLLADALDASALRNKIVYDFAARLGFEFTPETRWAELYLNGDYAGLYLLCERIEDDPQRLDLGPDGSLLCMDRDIRVEEDTTPFLVTNAGHYLQIREGTHIGPLKEQIQALEDAIFSPEGDWQNRIDLDSWVKKYLLEEIFGSYDAGFQSQYFYSREPGGKLYAGPIWDYDSSLGNPLVWSLNSPNGLYAWRPQAMTDYAPNWYHGLYQQEKFRQALVQTYDREILPRLEELTGRTLETYVSRIGEAYERNRIRWNVETRGLDAEAAHIADYLTQRQAFLSALWLENRAFCIVRLRESSYSGYYGYYAVEPGTVFHDLPQRQDEDFLGWYREDTEEPFDPAQPVTEDLCIYPKYEGVLPPVQEEEESLKDMILRLYHYAPLGALVLLGLSVWAVSLWKHPAGKTGKREHSHTGR